MIELLVTICLIATNIMQQWPVVVTPNPNDPGVNKINIDRNIFITYTSALITYGELSNEDVIFGSIADMKVLSDGCMVVSDRRFHRLAIIDADGKLIKYFGNRGQGPGELSIRHGGRLAVDTNDNIFIADGDNMRIQIFNRDGEYIGSHRTVSPPADIDIVSNEAIYCSYYIGSHILDKIDMSAWALDSILQRKGFTGEGKYLSNGWLLEASFSKVFLYHITSGLLLGVDLSTGELDRVYPHGEEVRKYVTQFLENDRPSPGGLSIDEIVIGTGIAADPYNGTLCVHMIDAKVGDYKAIAVLNDRYEFIRGIKVPRRTFVTGMTAHKGTLYTFSATDIYVWEQ